MPDFAIKTNKFYKSVTERVRTPDGTLFVTIMEDDDSNPIMIQVNGTKSGTSVAAWCDATARLCNIALRNGVDFMTLVQELSNITTSRALRLVTGAMCRSGPEGFAIALMRYRDGKNEERENQEEIDDSDDESDDVRPRWRIPPELR